jgi:uncharacterized protein (DUF427 family)
MAVMMRELLATKLDTLRYEPTAKRLRVSVGSHLVADTEDSLLVWEPKRLVPAYAVAEQNISAELISTGHHEPDPGTPPILDPRNPFTQHTTSGEVYDVVVGDKTLPSAAFRSDDPDLAGHILLDFGSFDWLEEDEPIVSHPHDPFHRIDILRSSRHVRIELEGRLLAESSAPVLLFETLLPVRFYLPRADVTSELQPNDTVSYCAYKGRASYFSLPDVRADVASLSDVRADAASLPNVRADVASRPDARADVAWKYPEPLREAEPVRDHVCFFDERVDVIVDGRRRDRPMTPWSD